nr:translation initiation factor 2 [Boldiaceae sp.]
MENNKIKKNLTLIKTNLIEVDNPKELVRAMKIYKLNKDENKIYNLVKPLIIYKFFTKKISDNFNIDKVNDNNSNLKHEKKSRFLQNLDENLESKKSKNKQKKRAKTKLYLKEDEDNLNELNNTKTECKNNNTISLSLMRPSRPNNNNLQLLSKKSQTKINKKKNSNNNNIIVEKKSQTIDKNIIIEKFPENIKLTNNITIKQLAKIILIPEQDIIKFLFLKGKIVTINQVIDIPTASLIGENFGVNITIKNNDTEEIVAVDMLDKSDLEKLITRPPIVTIMGHVDHGKTTLIDYIRNTRYKVVDKEKGGITQLIGAYQINIPYNEEIKKVTFLDTPGHEAFSGMRARGIKLTDIGILVVAADDGVKAQTVEAIEYLQRKKIPLIVALTKIDKDNTDIEKVKRELTNYNLIPEDWGGNIPMIPVSALTGENISKLLETIIIVAELENFQANPYSKAKGTVIESYIDRRTGPVATLIVQNGALKVGDIISAGDSYGKVRVITNDLNERIRIAEPSSSVKVWGLSKIAPIGENFETHNTEKEAKEKANLFTLCKIENNINSNLLNQYQYVKENGTAYLQIVIKTNTQGSTEAILHSFSKIPQALVNLQVLSANVGEITENDVELAYSANAWLVGFNTTLASGTKQAAERNDIKISEYQIIYDLIADTIKRMENLLEPEYIEEEIGISKVKAIFNLSKGVTAGCYVSSGKLKKDTWIHVIRNNKIIYKGNLESLKKVKEDVKEIDTGLECGIFIENFQNWQIGDIIKCFNLIKQKRYLK